MPSIGRFANTHSYLHPFCPRVCAFWSVGFSQRCLPSSQIFAYLGSLHGSRAGTAAVVFARRPSARILLRLGRIFPVCFTDLAWA